MLKVTHRGAAPGANGEVYDCLVQNGEVRLVCSDHLLRFNGCFPGEH